MKFHPTIPVVAAIALAAASASAHDGHAPPRVLEMIRSLESGGESLEEIHIHVKAVAGSRACIETTDSLEDPNWTPVAEPVLMAADEVALPVFVERGKTAEFYRAKVTHPPMDAARLIDGSLTIFAYEPATLADLLMLAEARWGIYAYPESPDMLDAPIPVNVLITERSVEALAARIGATVWQAAPPDGADPEAVAQQFPANEEGQVGEPVVFPEDEERGTGLLEDGWEGDPGLPEPESGPADPPEPGPEDDKEFDPGEGGAGDGPMDWDEPVPPGSHLAFSLFVAEGFAEVIAAAQPPGAIALPPARSPGPGEIVAVAGSLNVADNGGAYALTRHLNPLEAHVHEVPGQVEHDAFPAGVGTVAVSLPVRDGDAPNEMWVKLYRALDRPPTEVLTPGNFQEFEGMFQLIYQGFAEEILDQGSLPAAAGKAKGGGEKAASKASTMAAVHQSGPRNERINIVVIGDGFDDSAADQNAFNNYVDNTILRDFLNRDVNAEIANAINIFRVNTFSEDSGVTQVDKDGAVTASRSTALNWRFSHEWQRCWMEEGPGTSGTMWGEARKHVPEAKFVIAVLNESQGGGCRRGDTFAVTRASGWSTFAHEFGHVFVDLGDEYQCSPDSCGGTYPFGHDPQRNLSINPWFGKISWKDLKWQKWVPAFRPVPTSAANIAVTHEDCGAFEGATAYMARYDRGLFRPSFRGRMNDNTPPHNPVGYEAMRDFARRYQPSDFRQSVAGDFDGDGKSDLLLIEGRQLSVFLNRMRNTSPPDPVSKRELRPQRPVLDPAAVHNLRLGPIRWDLLPTDRMIAANVDGGSDTEVILYDLTRRNIPFLAILKWNPAARAMEVVRRYDRDLPGWGAMARGDQFIPCDYDGDGDDDLLVYNGTDFGSPYFLILRSEGDRFSYVRRFRRYLPGGWEMGRHEQILGGRFDEDGREDVVFLNTRDWSQTHLQMLFSNGSGFGLGARLYGNIPGWGIAKPNLEARVADTDGNGIDDFVLFNGKDWSRPYLGIIKNDSGQLSRGSLYHPNNPLPGWSLQRRDRFWVGDMDGDGNEDVVAFNPDNWQYRPLGILKSSGSSLRGYIQLGCVGPYCFPADLDLHIGEIGGIPTWRDAIAVSKDSCALLNSWGSRFFTYAYYPKWIHNHRFHALGHW
ncbi:MAG: M64 family metallopeptidase [Verrucomicrobiales bacterium]